MGPLPKASADHAFGKYSLVAKLATGGMAEIFLARLGGAAGFEKLVCIKRILPHLAKDQQLVDMFLAEAKIAARISHPNVCSVYELGDIDQRYFIAMEYLEGVPLACFRRRDMYAGEPDPRLVAGLGLQACEGLHHAHNLKKPDGTQFEVVHRDVSANNLFLTVDGVVKVLDFGIAKVQDASVKTSTGSVKGTYAYMAPEQLRGERVDRRTDLFALGAVLWELFARKHLFKRETDFLTFQAITTDPIRDLLEIRPDIPPELAAVIAKALARSPNDRFPTARAMGEALAKSVATLGGVWTASALSDEIERAFVSRLADQRGLIRIAREGGVMELDNDVGPAIGFGTELVTTPVSIVSGAGTRTTSDPQISDTVITPSQSQPIVRRAPRSTTMAVAKLPDLSPSRTGVWIAAGIVLAVVGAIVVWQMKLGPPTPEARVAIAPDVVVDAATAAAPTPSDAAATALPTVPVDAGVAMVPVDAAQVTITDKSPPKLPPKVPPKLPPKPGLPAVSGGPPGFITIDSSPGYAVIYIDGKLLGETPLVKISLAPGKHAVRAVSPSGISKNLSVTIESGKVAPTKRIGW